MRKNRWFLVLAYALATVLAQGFHHHRDGEDADAAHHSTCGDTRTHVEEGRPADTGIGPLHCLSCQFQSDHHSLLVAPPLFGDVPAGVSRIFGETQRPSPFALRASSRAPPRLS
jgi:hypothetical protein